MDKLFKNLLQLTDVDLDRIIEAVENLKNKDLLGEAMEMMVSAIAKPGKNATPDELKAYEDSQREREVKKTAKEGERKF